MIHAIAVSNHLGERVLKIGHIFIWVMIAFGSMSLGGCGYSGAGTIDVPADVKAVSDPFLNAIKKGDHATAEKYISKGAIDDAQDYYDDAQADLSKAPELKPVTIRYAQNMFGQPNTNDVHILYAAERKGIWTSMEMRLFRLEDERYEVEYWEVKAENKQPETLARGEQFKTWVVYGLIAFGLLGVLFLAFLFWFIRNKAHVLAPDPVIDSRPLASTQQDE
jgi:hypothetical protein